MDCSDSRRGRNNGKRNDKLFELLDLLNLAGNLRGKGLFQGLYIDKSANDGAAVEVAETRLCLPAGIASQAIEGCGFQWGA